VDGSHATAITDSSVGFFNLAWSPDDRRIAVARQDTAGDLQIWVMNAAGGEARALTRFAPADGRPQWPAWSADGRRIAIQSGIYDRTDPAKSTAHIWVIDVATGAATRLAEHAEPRLDETPSWFPDGRRIAFQSDRTGSFEIWVMSADGSRARPLTSEPDR
jgi:TolB protein